MYSDNETVDVASSDETEESDNEKEDNTAAVDSVDKCEVEKPRLKSPSLSEILLLGHNNLDFLSENSSRSDLYHLDRGEKSSPALAVHEPASWHVCAGIRTRSTGLRIQKPSEI